MSVATRAGSVLQAGSREVHFAAKGIVRIASLCLDGRGMTRRRLTLLVRFAKSVLASDTRQLHTPKRDLAGRPAGLHNVKHWCLYEASSFPEIGEKRAITYSNSRICK
jgi:hypothetical protein